MVVTVSPLIRNIRRDRRPTQELPKVLGVRSGASWDEVRIRLVPGQKPEDFDDATRALASARGVARCQVRELTPNVVSIDFQRRNLLADPVACPDLAGLANVDGSAVDLGRVWSGRTEYGQDWHVPLAGGHTLVAGSTGAGKNSVMWCPLVSIAPAIRDGLVRVSGIDPKGMELAYGRRIFTRYAVTGTDALAVLDDLVAAMDARKTQFAGRVRTVPISRDHPLELLEFDEIGALTKYTDRKTRDAITEKVALLTTQGRALGFTVRGYVQEPTKDTVPVRELFPRRVCLRVSAKSHVGMVLGEQAFERGAWANRIGESEAGVGYVWSAKASANHYASGRAGYRTRRSSNSKRSSPARSSMTLRYCPSPPNQAVRPDRPGEERRERHFVNHRCELRGGGELLAAHLADHVLPQPASLAVATRDRRLEVTVQLDSLTMPMVAVELLAWADTLTTVTIGAWRPPAGDRVHLSIASTLTGPTGTVSLDVYGGADHNPALIADLEPGQRVALSLGQLRTWADSASNTGGGPE